MAASAWTWLASLRLLNQFEPMEDNKTFDAVIVGGSYAGLSAAMALGRSLRSVLIIDSGMPCNRQTPHAHNFITQDGATPAEISAQAREQVLEYPTVKSLNDLVVSVSKTSNQFIVSTQKGATIKARKILFATGVKDIMPNVKGFADCWGISVLHCPYCHGYEVANHKLGIIANGEAAFELCKLIQHWSDKLTLFTNGKSTLTAEQHSLLYKLNIEVVQKEIKELKHRDGYLETVIFSDETATKIDAVFSRVAFKQHCNIPIELGCNTDEQGYVEIDAFQRTNAAGVFCAGDNTTPFRALPIAIAAGTKAGASINMELLNEELPA